MKLLPLSVSFGIILIFSQVRSLKASVTDEEEKIRKAEEEKRDYESEKLKGLVRLKEIIPDDGKFGRILSWIRDEEISLCRGKEDQKSCYTLTDVDSEIETDRVAMASWLLTPYTQKKELTNKWYEKLYNSVGKILLTETGKETPILLSKGDSKSEEKSTAGKIGLGDEKTFGKSGRHGKKVGAEIKLNVEDSFKNMKATVDKVLRMILDAFATELAKDKEIE